nr:tRNA threonylcarbamoyladenosine dehydratase [uncultured Oribacterium sp.]
MEGQFSRTERLLGAEAVEKLSKAKVIVFGIGGVGGYCVESLVRSGVGQIDVVDDDVVCLSNLNRQIIATRDTVGRAKVELAEERIHSINPDCKVRAFRCFYLPETKDQFDFSAYDYVVDAVDTVAAKLSLIEAAKEAGVPIISAMGAGNKLNPAGFKVADLYETKICPLAKVMRRECKKRGIESLKVVYSEEMPRKPIEQAQNTSKIPHTEPSRVDLESPQIKEGGEDLGHPKAKGKRSIPGSVAFVPPVVGLIMGGEIVKDLLQ